MVKGYTKVPKEQHDEILRRYAAGESAASIAKDFSVHRETVRLLAKATSKDFGSKKDRGRMQRIATLERELARLRAELKAE
jgi:transposase-like protein